MNASVFAKVILYQRIILSEGMERVLLINPPQIYYGKAFRASTVGWIGLPLGLLYIAALLETKGCQVKVLDCLVSSQARLKRSHRYILYGIPEEKLVYAIEEYKPQIVGITNQFTTQEENLLKTARLVKEIDSSILVVAGGANISCRGKYLLSDGSIDIAVKGEGEATVVELIDYFRQKKTLEQIKGIIFRKGGKVFESGERSFIKDIDSLPFPAYHLVEMEKYLTLYQRGIYTRDRDVKRNISMITSRGCPFHCIFCSIWQTMGRQWRPHSSDYVKRHILELSRNFRIKHIHFEDDNLFFRLERFLPILDVLAKEKISWDTPNGIRVDLSLTEDILRMMKRSGCKSLTIGVESGDIKTLREIIRKDIHPDEVIEFARRCKKVGLPLRAFFVLGFPGETPKAMQKTVDFALELLKKYDVEPINLIATPLFGTALYRICQERNYFTKEITPQALSESTVSDGFCLIKTEEFSAQQVERLSQDLTARAYRILLRKGLKDPVASLKRVGNFYILRRTLRRLLLPKWRF